MWLEGTLEKVIITIDGEDRVLHSYGEAWVQDGPKPLIHPLAVAIVWVLLQGVINEKIPPSSEAYMHRMLTTLQLLFSHSDHMPRKRMQKVMDKLLAEDKKDS